MSKLGEALKDARKNLGFTLRQVEDSTGISNAYLSQLENNKIKNPSVNILSKLSSLYRISLKSLLSNANMIDEQDEEKHKENFSFAQRIAFKAEDLTEEEKKELLKYLEYIRHRKNND